jgi:hypothetical protein
MLFLNLLRTAGVPCVVFLSEYFTEGCVPMRVLSLLILYGGEASLCVLSYF